MIASSAVAIKNFFMVAPIFANWNRPLGLLADSPGFVFGIGTLRHWLG